MKPLGSSYIVLQFNFCILYFVFRQVNDVQLPVWANGDPCEFVRRNREVPLTQTDFSTVTFNLQFLFLDYFLLILIDSLLDKVR